MSQEVIEVTEREVEIVEIIERGPTGPTGPQPDINYTVVSSNTTLQAADLIAANTAGGSFTLTLPANPSAGDAVDIFDYSDTFDTNNLTIARNGQPIESLAEDLVCNVEGAYFTLIYTGATRGWQVLPRYGTSGGGGETVLTNQGDMLYRGVVVNARLPIGTAGQVLKVNSGATAPEWGTISSAPSGPAGGTDLTGTYPNPTLTTTGVGAGTYTKVTVDTKGRVTTGATATPVDIGAAASVHTHATSDITSGTMAVARLPIFTYGPAGQGLVPQSIGGQAGQFLKGDGNWTAVTKSDVGLSNVDNTSDSAKPISTATQTALNLKANLDSPALTGTPTAPTASAGTNTTQIATTAFTLANRGDRYLTTSTSSHSLTTGTKTFTVQSGLSYTPTQDVTIVYDADPTNKHMHGVVTSYSGTTLVVNVQTVDGSGGPFTAWTINVGGLLSSEGALYSANNLSDVANTATALTNLGGVPTSRTITAGTGLTGGGDLTANRTLAVSYGSSAGTACEGNDPRLSDSRQALAHKTSHQSGGSDELALAASQITSGTFDNARINFAAPAAIGSTTPAAGAFTNLVANTELQLPTNAPASPTAGDLYRVSDTLRYRDSSNNERLLLNATDNLANLASAATARTNLGLGSASTRAIDAISDADFRVVGSSDATKKIAFEADTNISASTTRTFTAPNRNGTMVVSDTSAGSGSDVVNNIVSLTQAEYNAIGSPDAATLYLITDP